MPACPWFEMGACAVTDIVTLEPIAPGAEVQCPSWQGFPAGTLVRYAGSAPSPADSKVMTLDGIVIVEFLPYMHAVGRAQIEAAQRNACVRVVIGETANPDEQTVMTPEGVFAAPPRRS